jgi:Carboxypeptidase regulatory-like domain
MKTQTFFTRLMGGVLALALLLSATPAAAQTLSGTIAGRIVDAQGASLPGVLVTLVSRTGETTQTTDAQGDFRFLGLNPGMYEVRASLQGFKPAAQSNIDISIGRSVDIKLTLAVGGMTEAITVVGSAASIDTTTTATDTNISQDLLFSMPISRTNAAVNILNNAPGINSGSAFGGASGSANSLRLDGVDVRDPEGGTAWAFFNYNIIDQVQVGSIGQPAEMGGFTGAIINTITKSGSNRRSGLFEYRYSEKGLRGNNVSSTVTKVNPAIKATGVDELKDYTVQLGGPIRTNKAFYFASIQRYAIKQDPDGPRTIRTEVSPRFNGKLTLQPTSSDNIMISAQYDMYNQTGRTGQGGTNGTTDASTVVQDSPEIIYNGQYRKVIGNSSVLEAKFTGYWGYFDLDPKTPTPSRLDGATGAYSGGAGYSAQYDRTRNQLNTSLAKYVEAKGTHAFKFGAEIERSTIRNRYSYTDGLFFYDYGGAPYLAYAYSYDVKGRNDRQSLFVQDQWQTGRLTLNGGVRYDRITGTSTTNDKQYYNTTSWSPRLGAAYDLMGDGKSVVRAYYGQLYDGAVFSSWSQATPGIGDYVTYEVSPTGRLTEVGRISGASKFTVDDKIKHPRTDEWSLAYERQLFRGLKLSATYIRRDSKNFINSVLQGAQWATTSFTNPLTNQPMTVYRWANRTSDQKFLITNVDNFAYNGAPAADAYRTYNGAMFVLTRGFSNRWQAQVSYVYSKTKGTVTNGTFSGISSSQFQTPNLALVNSDGLVGFDRKHEVKVFAGYQIPKLEISANMYYRYLSGFPWTPFRRVPASTFNWTGSIDLNLEARGSRRTENQQLMDLRFEKVFQVGVNRLGLYLDAENLLNAGFVTAVQTRHPSVTISGVSVPMGGPTAVTSARQLTFGGRWSF